jgi:hypothetical protein
MERAIDTAPQQATGNRQQATGNRQQAKKNPRPLLTGGFEFTETNR